MIHITYFNIFLQEVLRICHNILMGWNFIMEANYWDYIFLHIRNDFNDIRFGLKGNYR